MATPKSGADDFQAPHDETEPRAPGSGEVKDLQVITKVKFEEWAGG